MSTRWRSLFGPPAFILSLSLIAPAAPNAGPRPDFSGTWKLNEELSDNPRDKIIEAMPERPPGGGRSGFGGSGGRRGRGGGRGDGRGGGRGGGDGRGGFGGGRVGGPEGDGYRGERMRDRMRFLIEGGSLLTIEHQDPRLTIRDAMNKERTLFTDGRVARFEFASDLWEAKTKWKKGRKVVLKAKSARGRKLSETIEFSEDDSRLMITIKMSGGGRMPSFEFVRVYDPAPADTVPASAKEKRVGDLGGI